MAATIVIDAGHGGSDSGAVYKGRLEKDDNLRLALAVGDLLKQAGYNVIYTRTEDVFDFADRESGDRESGRCGLFCVIPPKFQSVCQHI